MAVAKKSLDFAAFVFVVNGSVCCNGARVFDDVYFYFRFAPGTATILLLTPLAFVLKVPYIIPVVYGLIGTPVYVVPVAWDNYFYFMLHFVSSSATAFKKAVQAQRD